MRTSNAPFIVGMRALLLVFEASRHEASFKTVFPPIGAVAPVTSVPAGGYVYAVHTPKAYLIARERDITPKVYHPLPRSGYHFL